MATGQATLRHARSAGAFTGVLKLVIEPSAAVEESQRGKWRLLSLFFLLLTINCLAGAIIGYEGDFRGLLIGISAIFFAGFILIRTRFYQAAVFVAVVLPAAPVMLMLFNSEGVSNPIAILMWVALPLLILSLIQSMRYVIIITAVYIAGIIQLGFSGFLNAWDFGNILSFILIVAFVEISFAAINRKNYAALESQLAERKAAEEALKESEEKFSKAFSASSTVICITSLRDSSFMEVNESFTRFTGYTREEAVGRTGDDLDLWVKPEELKLWTDTLKRDGRVYNHEISSRAKSGEIRTGLGSAEVINIGGQPCRITVIVDITERKKAEVELEQSAARQKAANKELEAFSYSVSHDLRSPLRSIDGFSQALLEDYADSVDDTGRDYLKRLRNASQKMGELIDGLLKLSRLNRGELRRETVDMSALANEIGNRLQETQPERKADLVIASGLTADGDPQLMRALLENLLGNAWKFTGKTPRARIEFGSFNNSGHETFFVKDNGAGFDMSFADKLFGVFQRLHDVAEFPGSGIGLATVRRIINRHGGTVRAEAEVGKGATFYFTLD